MVTGDIVGDIVDYYRRLLAETADLRDVEALHAKIERDARQSYAGERVYVLHNRRMDKAASIAKIRADGPASVQVRELGLARSTVYRYIAFKKGGRSTGG